MYQARYTDNALQQNPLYKGIIETQAFKRLSTVSFLGAIEYVLQPIHYRAKQTRAEHSIGVAELALCIAKKRNYSEDIQNHLVVAALLHDIGHAPLSHSIESCFKEKFGIDHHVATLKILYGKTAVGMELNKLLKQFVDIDHIVELISQANDQPHSDVFNNPINIDTIDGIFRSAHYLFRSPQYSPEDVAVAAFAPHEEIDLTVLDTFWQCKHDVYEHLITSGIGAIADEVGKQYFAEHSERFSQSDYFIREDTFRNKYQALFQDLRNLKQVKLCSDEDGTMEFELVKRSYTIDHSVPLVFGANLNGRFHCTKIKINIRLSLSQMLSRHPEQLQLSFQ